MRRGLLVLALPLVVVAGCEADSIEVGPPTTEEYAVYSAALRHFLSAWSGVEANGSEQVLLLDDRTYTPMPEPHEPRPTADYLYDAAPRQLVRDFLSKNRDRHPLQDRFPATFSLELQKSASLDSIFADEDWPWENFYERYPDAGGIVRVSRVGMSASGDEALLYLDVYSGNLHGHGWYARLSKRGDQWTVSEVLLELIA